MEKTTGKMTLGERKEQRGNWGGHGGHGTLLHKPSHVEARSFLQLNNDALVIGS